MKNSENVTNASKNHLTTKRNLKIMAFTAVLAAMSIIFGKVFALNLTPSIRISLGNLPIFVAGIFFGPVAGIIVGALGDLVGCLIMGYAINPLITVGAMLVGGISGALFKYSKPIFKNINSKKVTAVRIYVSIFVSYLIGSVIVKSAALAIMYQNPFFPTLLSRIPSTLATSVVEFYIIFLLAVNKSFMKFINEINLTKEGK